LFFCTRRPRAVYTVHFQSVNVRSACRPSTRCTWSAISLFLHRPVLDSLSVLFFSVLFFPLFRCDQSITTNALKHLVDQLEKRILQIDQSKIASKHL